MDAIGKSDLSGGRTQARRWRVFHRLDMDPTKPMAGRGPENTAVATMQCIYSSVSKASHQKTGVLWNSACDFRELSPKKFENGATGDFQQLEKPAMAQMAFAEHHSLADRFNRRHGFLFDRTDRRLAGPDGLSARMDRPSAALRDAAPEQSRTLQFAGGICLK